MDSEGNREGAAALQAAEEGAGIEAGAGVALMALKTRASPAFWKAKVVLMTLLVLVYPTSRVAQALLMTKVAQLAPIARVAVVPQMAQVALVSTTRVDLMSWVALESRKWWDQHHWDAPNVPWTAHVSGPGVNAAPVTEEAGNKPIILCLSN